MLWLPRCRVKGYQEDRVIKGKLSRGVRGEFKGIELSRGQSYQGDRVIKGTELSRGQSYQGDRVIKGSYQGELSRGVTKGSSKGEM